MANAGKAIRTNEEEWVSLSEAARLLKESRPTVLQRVIGGQLTAQRIAKRTIIARESIDRVIAARK